jgi:hypothetical protein
VYIYSLRTEASLRYFPRVFFVYFSLYHVYFFCFPFGFSYPALMCTVLFLTHAMYCFWNYCEIPAFRAGHVTALHPRFGVSEGTAVLNTGSHGASRSTGRNINDINTGDNRVTRARSRSVPRRSNNPLQVYRNTIDELDTTQPSSPAAGPMSTVRRPSFHLPTTRRLTGAPRFNFNRTGSPLVPAGQADTYTAQYTRHVELSRRIQHQQMLAMMGLEPTPPSADIGLDLDAMHTRSDVVPPQPQRLRMTSQGSESGDFSSHRFMFM